MNWRRIRAWPAAALVLLGIGHATTAQTLDYMSGLTAGGAVSSTDTFYICQLAGGCGVGTNVVRVTAGTLASYFAANIPPSSITYAKIQNEAANTVLGNPTASAAAPAEVALGTTGTSTVLLTNSSGQMAAPVATTTGSFSGLLTYAGAAAGTVTGSNWLGVDASNHIVTGTPPGGGGGLSGMTTGQVPIAATATTVTSSQAAGTTGTSVILTSDAGGNAKAPVNTTTGTFSGALTTNITGPIQCVHASAGGVLSGTGSDCGGGGTLTTTDGTHTVTATTTMTFGNGFLVGGSAGSATVNTTISDPAAKTASYTIAAADMGNAVPLGGSSGTPALTLPAVSSTLFSPGMSVAVVVSGTVNWTLTNSTGIALAGTGTTLCPGDTGVFIANTPGTGLDYFGKSCSALSTFGEVHGGAYAPTLTSNNYNAVIGDCGQILQVSNAAAATVTLPNIVPPAGRSCVITIEQTGAGNVSPAAASGGTLTANVNAFTKTKGVAAFVNAVLRTPSATAAVWDWTGDGQ